MSAGSTGSTVECDHGMTTSLKQDESARVCWKNSVLRCASWASCGTVGRRRATRPRSSARDISARSCCSIGSAARSVSGPIAGAGQRLDRERAQRRQRPVERPEGGLALLEEVGQQLDRPAQGAVLGGERAGDRAQVRDQVAERLLVAPEAAQDPAEPADQAAQVVRLGPELRLVDLGRVAVGDRRRAEQVAQALGAAVAGSARCRTGRAGVWRWARTSVWSVVRIWSSWTE